MSGPPQQKLCAFCGGDAAAHGGRLGRMEGPYNASRSGYEAVYVHHECAVWSPKVNWLQALLALGLAVLLRNDIQSAYKPAVACTIT
jgi:hypothetical protein